MYNSYPGAAQYGRPAEYGAFPGASPGMAPPGTAAPGTTAPGTMHQADPLAPGRPAAYPPSFQPPANMPNINFSAPVIRLGTTTAKPADSFNPHDERDRERGGGGRKAGLGSGYGGQEFSGGGGRGEKERILAIQPQTKEEIIRTIFVGGITDGVGGDDGVERILRAVGGLRRWFRATDAEDKPCRFGFAEYEDPESLRTAVEVLKDVEVPVRRVQATGVKKEEGEDDGDTKVEMSKLLIVADDNAATYIEQWEDTQDSHHEDQKEMLLDQAREALRAVLADLSNPNPNTSSNDSSALDQDGDIKMREGQAIDALTGEIVTIPLNVDDELADIPAEMRETVAKEIAAFRDRSNRRDIERMKREEELELQERTRMANGGRSRLASPPPTAPSGPAGNGVPVGPRGAPSGPKAFGQQIPRDYQKGVVFVNGTSISGASAFEDEDTDASDSELENRRMKKKEAELEKQYLDQERRWLNRERARTSAIEREKTRDEHDAERVDKEKEAMAKQLREWDDDAEAARKVEEYYADRSIWIRNRASFRQREIANDDADRAAEHREEARRPGGREDNDSATDGRSPRHDRQPSQLDDREATTPTTAPREPARFKLSLGAAAQQRAQANALATPKRTVADVEGLLEDEEEVSTTQRRTLIPIEYDSSTVAAQMTDEERAAAAKQLAADIPTDKAGLWKWAVKWEFVDESVIEERLRPFVEKKIVEYLGVQEDMLVDVVVGALRNKRSPDELVGELEGALDEEAEVLVKKLWRMVIFFSESEKRGLSA